VPALNQLASEIRKQKLDNVKKYVEDARALRLIVGSGVIGKRIHELSESGSPLEARMVTLIGCPQWLNAHDLAREYFDSLSGIAAVSVPALFYAWLLKNVSRVFIQNLNLADDAQHRQALALTYLGLAANPNLGVAEKDRVLILNAMFRPIPNQLAEDGPPAGLMELIRKKD
jgi:hypothetical protein